VPLHDEAVQQSVAAGIEEFRNQLANVTGLEFTDDELEQCGLNVMGVERLINHRLGVGRKDDTLPDRWFDEPNPPDRTRASASIARNSTRCCRASTRSRG
jgi:aldehyde:ferredoxin oxidoreductase